MRHRIIALLIFSLTLILSGCTPDNSGAAICGNGRIDEGEQCDGAQMNGMTCEDLGYGGGVLQCSSQCLFDLNTCIPTTCGNGVVDGVEECDGNDLGDLTCESFGFIGGFLRCTPSCHYDTSACSGGGNDTNNGDNNGNNGDNPLCGNGVIDPGESCDGPDLGTATCRALGYDDGELGCTTSCEFDTSHCTYATCGDGKIDPGEECDGIDLNGASCTSLGYPGGMLGCLWNCRYDTSGCYVCGNNRLDPGEQCDGHELGGMTCQDLGWLGGDLQCDMSCHYYTSGCWNDTGHGGGDDNNGGTNNGGDLCGNGQVDSGEQCDGNNLAGQTCSSLGYDGGTLACTSTCSFDVSGCTAPPTCGNGNIDSGEECDGNNLGGETCVTLGHDGGTLVCNSNCTLDDSGCTDDTNDRAAEVCQRWNTDMAYAAARTPGTWNGDYQTCDAGTYSSEAKDAALRITNLYRWMAGLPPVSVDSSLSDEVQQCAVMEAAMGYLSHTPSSDVPCYSQTAYDGSSHSLIAQGNAVRAVHMYMADWGASNADLLGHRRWILSHWFTITAIGSTLGSLPHVASCEWVIGSSNHPTNSSWTAFPTPGPFPYQALNPTNYRSIDDVGWSIQSDVIDFSNATVRVTDGGTQKPVTQSLLTGRYGSEYAIKFVPNGWSSQIGHTYHVEVTGVSQNISYDVTIVDCDQY